MKVTLLNPDEAKNLFQNWGISSSVCYDTKTDTPEKLGKGCMLSGHYSGSRGDFIKFRVDDCPRFTIDQAVRHEIGVFKNVQSFRYVGKNSFAYEIPTDIMDNQELIEKYIAHMDATLSLYEEIQLHVYNKTGSRERANEQARYVLPMATKGSFVIGFTVEALIHFMNMRLCLRAEDKIRELAKLMKEETLKVIPDKTLENRLVPNCQFLLWCPEGKKTCGAYPTKKELKELLSKYKELENSDG